MWHCEVRDATMFVCVFEIQSTKIDMPVVSIWRFTLQNK